MNNTLIHRNATFADINYVTCHKDMFGYNQFQEYALCFPTATSPAPLQIRHSRSSLYNTIQNTSSRFLQYYRVKCYQVCLF